MKSTLAPLCLGVLLTSLAASASAGPGAGARTASPALSSSVPSLSNLNLPPQYQQVQNDALWGKRPLSNEALRQIARLRAEGLTLQKADGGTLTSEHRAYLQHKLDAIRTVQR